MRLILIAIGLAGLATTPAWATATLSCEASLMQIAFRFTGVVPSGQGSPLLQVRGEVTASPEGIVPRPAVIALSDANRTQYWLDEDMLNLTFYSESDAAAFSSALLTIRTRARAGEPEYFDGKFHFESYQAPANEGGEPVEVNMDGKVTCSVG